MTSSDVQSHIRNGVRVRQHVRRVRTGSLRQMSGHECAVCHQPLYDDYTLRDIHLTSYPHLMAVAEQRKRRA